MILGIDETIGSRYSEGVGEAGTTSQRLFDNWVVSLAFGRSPRFACESRMRTRCEADRKGIERFPLDRPLDSGCGLRYSEGVKRRA